MSKILLLGGSGILGSELKGHLKDCYAPTREELDLLTVKASKLDKLISEYDIIINCAVLKDSKRLQHMFHVNTLIPTYIAEKVNKKRHKSVFIHISTDYVFDGVGGSGKQPYPEILPMYPQFHLMPEYSFTKFMAENNVLIHGGYIIRTSFYPTSTIEKAPTSP